MKTKELIRLLQEIDSAGETECCVANADIQFIERLPSYYDGNLQVIEFDEDGRPVSGKYYERGHKISLHYLSIGEAVMENSDFPVNYDDLNEVQRRHKMEYIEKCRKESRELDEEFDRKSRKH